MPSIPVTDVAFTGFRIVRERPRAVALWAALQLAVSFGAGALVVEMAGPRMARIEALAASPSPDPAAILGQVAAMAPLYAVLVVVAVAVQAVVIAAMCRTVIRPDDDRFGYFRLGRDELNLAVVLVAMIALGLGVELAAAVIAGLVGSVAALSGLPVESTALAVAIVTAAAGWMVLAVRLSLAPAQTLAIGRIDLPDAWRLTRGRFWPILGVYVLAAALALVVLMLGMVVAAALVALVGGMGAVAQMGRPDYASLAGFYSPARLAQTAVGAILNALVTPVLFCPTAALYLRLAAGSGPRPGA